MHGFVVSVKKRLPNGKVFLQFGKAFSVQSQKKSDAEKGGREYRGLFSESCCPPRVKKIPCVSMPSLDHCQSKFNLKIANESSTNSLSGRGEIHDQDTQSQLQHYHSA